MQFKEFFKWHTWARHVNPDHIPHCQISSKIISQVVEAFFLNDAKQYLEIEVDPHGRYIGLLLDGQRNAIYISGPQFFKVNMKNLCLHRTN